MRVQVITALSALAGSVQGVRIMQSNDDGWAELYIRSLHESLKGAGHDVVLSAPAENKSGSSESASSSTCIARWSNLRICISHTKTDFTDMSNF